MENIAAIKNQALDGVAQKVVCNTNFKDNMKMD